MPKPKKAKEKLAKFMKNENHFKTPLVDRMKKKEYNRRWKENQLLSLEDRIKKK